MLLVTVGVGLVSCVCAVFDSHLPTGNVQVTGEPEVARQPRGHGFEKHANRDHQPHEREDVESLMAFWR